MLPPWFKSMRYAIDHGADIINASWGVDIRSELMRTAVEEAAEADVLFVAAGGNRRSEQLFYPAAFENTIGVGATDRNDQRTRFSNFGSFIDLAAPGQTIFSTLPDNRFGFLSGTSMAAPHVSGAAVLALARHPDWSAQDLTRMLLNAVDPIQQNKPIGSGRLNVWKAQQVVAQDCPEQN
jgi:subtilisin family serine protease